MDITYPNFPRDGMIHQVDKVDSKGDKCPVMTMQIYGWTLVILEEFIFFRG